MASRLPTLSDDFYREARPPSSAARAREAASAIVRQRMLRRAARTAIMFGIVAVLGFCGGEVMSMAMGQHPLATVLAFR